jgi:HlyD family secretion protein
MGAKSEFQPNMKWLMAGAAAASAGLILFGLSQIDRLRGQQQPTASPTPTVTPAASRNITALGRIEPEGEVLDISGPDGIRVEQLLVRESDFVSAGQALAYLDGYLERLAERDLAATQLAEAQAKLSSETTFGQAQIREAEARVQMSRDPKTAEILAQQATIQRLQAELAAAERNLKRLQQLRREGAISQQALDDQTLAVRSKQEQINNAQATLSQLKKQQSTELATAQAQLQSARAGLTRSQSQVLVASATGNLKLANAKLEQVVLRAPRAGQILKVFTHKGEALGSQGLLQMGNTRQMYVVAEVYETDIAKVQAGQTATITSAAFPTPLSGRVERVGLRIGKNDVLNTDPAANTDVRVVEVRIRLDDSRLVSGLTNLQVDVVIQPTAAPSSNPNRN